MECLAKMEFQDCQGSRFVCLFVCSLVRIVCYVLFLSGPCLCHHGVICCSGHCWTFRPDGFKGGAGRQWCSREGEIMPNLPSSLGCKDSQWNCFVLAFIRCQPSSTIFAAWGNYITLQDIIAIFVCRSFDLICTRVVIFSLFLQGSESGLFYLFSWSFKPKGALDAIWTRAFVVLLTQPWYLRAAAVWQIFYLFFSPMT